MAAQLDKAATGTVDTVEVEIALRLVLMLEGVKCRPKRRRAGSPPPLVARGVRRGSFIVKDATGQALAYCYFEDEPQRQMSMGRLSKDEARRPEVDFACRTCLDGAPAVTASISRRPDEVRASGARHRKAPASIAATAMSRASFAVARIQTGNKLS